MHTLLEHFYDSRRNENGAQLADIIGGSQSREDLLSPLRQFQRRVATVGSVAHLVKDPGGLLVMSRGGDRGEVHRRDGQEAVSQPTRSCLPANSDARFPR